MTTNSYALPTGLPTHIPEDTQGELEIVMQILLDSAMPVGIVWLYGSYARGDFIRRNNTNESGITTVYCSDIDLLVVMKDSKAVNPNKWSKSLDRAFTNHPKLISRIHTLYITSTRLNRALQTGKYFYHDVVTEGVKLYDSGEIQPASYRELPKSELQGEVRFEFEEIFERALGFQKGFEFHLLEKNHTLAAFNLHQMAENLLHTLIMVFSNYRHRSHSLEFLEQRAASQYQPVLGIFPRESEDQQLLFNRLQEAYVDARYNKHYTFERHQLIEVARNVAALQQLVFDACTERVQSYAPERKVKPYNPTQAFLNMDTLLNTPPPKELIARQREELEQALEKAVLERKAREKAEEEKDLALEEKERERKARERAEEEKERLQKLLKKAGIDPSQD